MELFAFGILAGAVLSLITIGGINIAMDKGESSEYRSNDGDNNMGHWHSRSVDRLNKDIKEINDHAKKLGVKLDNE
jgi:hypothetical protein